MPCQDDEDEIGLEARWKTFHHIYSTKIKINLRTHNVQLWKYINETPYATNHTPTPQPTQSVTAMTYGGTDSLLQLI